MSNQKKELTTYEVQLLAQVQSLTLQNNLLELRIKRLETHLEQLAKHTAFPVQNFLWGPKPLLSLNISLSKSIMITEIDDLSGAALYDSLFDPDPPHSSTCQMFIDGQYIEVTPTEYAERFQELQAQSQAQMQEFRQYMEQQQAEARARHAQHPNMPNFCHECNRYYEFEATYPVEILIKKDHVFLGDYKFGVGDTAYICTRCNEEIGEVEFMELVKVHRFYPPR